MRRARVVCVRRRSLRSRRMSGEILAGRLWLRSWSDLTSLFSFPSSIPTAYKHFTSPQCEQVFWVHCRNPKFLKNESIRDGWIILTQKKINSSCLQQLIDFLGYFSFISERFVDVPVTAYASNLDRDVIVNVLKKKYRGFDLNFALLSWTRNCPFIW